MDTTSTYHNKGNDAKETEKKTTNENHNGVADECRKDNKLNSHQEAVHYDFETVFDASMDDLEKGVHSFDSDSDFYITDDSDNCNPRSKRQTAQKLKKKISS